LNKIDYFGIVYFSIRQNPAGNSTCELRAAIAISPLKDFSGLDVDVEGEDGSVISTITMSKQNF
jgi:hypothetical protein